MITIGRKYQGPSRNWAEYCDYCGVLWHRHELRMDEDGYLACPDDQPGRSVKAIDYQRAVDSSEPSTVKGKTRDYR